MNRKIILAVASIIVSLSAASAQTSERTFQRYNRWMVGGEFVRNIFHANGFGVTGIYGRQFSEIVFLGAGFGVDTFIYNGGKSTTTIIDADGTQTVIIRPPYRYSFLVPVYADLHVNFSRSRSPFFGELKVGGAVQVDLERIRGTHNTSAMEIASRSRGTPRIANRFLRRVRDFAEVMGDGTITKEAADLALKRLEVDHLGLDPIDRRMLTAIIRNYSDRKSVV